MTLPNWFLKVLAGCALLLTTGGIPWASWVTYTLICIQAADRTNEVERNTTRIAALEKSREEHSAQFQIISATRFTAEHGRLLTSGLEARFDRLGEKLDELRREFDRTFPKRNGE